MFYSPVPAKYDDPILITWDDELKHERPEPARKRRKTDLDGATAAAAQRRAARARMEEARVHRSSNAYALQAMALTNHNVHGPGSMLINPLRKPDQEPIYVHQEIAQNMKPHQLEGVQFLWRELTGDLNKARLHGLGGARTKGHMSKTRLVSDESIHVVSHS
jgi:hypothetical protein